MTTHRHRPYRDLPTHHHGFETFALLALCVLVGWVVLHAAAEAVAVGPRAPLPTTRHYCADTGPAPWQGVYVPGWTLTKPAPGASALSSAPRTRGMSDTTDACL